MRSILSPVDFSEPSRLALRWAEALARRFGGRLTILSVVDVLLAEASMLRRGEDSLPAETEAALREFAGATWPGGQPSAVPMTFTTATGEPATAIVDIATATGADLIVMGTQGLGGLKKWLLGSTTERVLRRTRVPVLTVPPAASDGSAISRIVAAIDFSEPSVAAAKMAVTLAREFSAELTLAHAVEPVVVPRPWQPLVQHSDEARTILARAKLLALSEEICGDRPCELAVEVGRAAELIGTVAAGRRAQMIVMGLAGERGGFAPRPGSIAYRVLSSTTIPVLVVPAAGR